MPTDIVMPQMGESIVEGTITKWLKKPGDKIQRDEPLFEISTDKVDAEIPAPASGVLSEIKVTEGTTVQVNTVVGTISSDGEGAAMKSAPVAAEKKAAPAPVPQPAPSASDLSHPSKTAKGGAPSVEVVPPVPAPPKHDEDDHARSSPLVRKIAREHNVDLSQVEGSGLGGRITKQDILAFLDSGSASVAPSLSRPTLARPDAEVEVSAPLPAPRPTPAEIPGDLVP